LRAGQPGLLGLPAVPWTLAAERVHTDDNGTGVGIGKEPSRADAASKTRLKARMPMATLYKDPRSGTYVIQVFDLEGKRRTLRTGVRDKQGAEHILWHIDNLLTAKRAAIPLPPATAEWLRWDRPTIPGQTGSVRPGGTASGTACADVGATDRRVFGAPETASKSADAGRVALRYRATTGLPENTPIDQITPADARQSAPSVQKPAREVHGE
jgi:hypothetical protein